MAQEQAKSKIVDVAKRFIDVIFKDPEAVQRWNAFAQKREKN